VSAVSILYDAFLRGGNTPADSLLYAETYVQGAMTGQGLSWAEVQSATGVSIPAQYQVTVSANALRDAATAVAQQSGIDVRTNAGQIAVDNIVPDMAIEAAKGQNVTSAAFATSYATKEHRALDAVEVAAKAQSQAAVELNRIITNIASSSGTTTDAVVDSNPQLVTELNRSLVDRALDQQISAVVATSGPAPAAPASTTASTQQIVTAVTELSKNLTGQITAGLSALERSLQTPAEPLAKGTAPAGLSSLMLLALGGIGLALLIRRG